MINKGFSLIETVIVVGLSAVLLIVFTGLYLKHNFTYNYEQALVRSAGSARTAFNEINNLTLQATRVVSSANINGTVYNTGTNVMVLEIPSVDSSGNTVNGVYDYAVFYASGTNLYREMQANALSSRVTGTKLLSDSFSLITFTYNNATYSNVTKVNVDLVTAVRYKEQTAGSRLQQDFTLRNY